MHTIAFISQIINAKQNRCLHKDHNGWAWLAKILLVDTFNKENVLAGSRASRGLLILRV